MTGVSLAVVCVCEDMAVGIMVNLDGVVFGTIGFFGSQPPAMV